MTLKSLLQHACSKASILLCSAFFPVRGTKKPQLSVGFLCWSWGVVPWYWNSFQVQPGLWSPSRNQSTGDGHPLDRACRHQKEERFKWRLWPSLSFWKVWGHGGTNVQAIKPLASSFPGGYDGLLALHSLFSFPRTKSHAELCLSSGCRVDVKILMQRPAPPLPPLHSTTEGEDHGGWVGGRKGAARRSSPQHSYWHTNYFLKFFEHFYRGIAN